MMDAQLTSAVIFHSALVLMSAFIVDENLDFLFFGKLPPSYPFLTSCFFFFFFFFCVFYLSLFFTFVCALFIDLYIGKKT